MTDHVWVSGALNDIRLTLFVENNVSSQNAEMAIKAADLNKDGEPVPAELCPSRIWADKDAPDYERVRASNIPPLFFANAYWIVAERAAEILSAADLGGGAVRPVTEGMFEEDNATRIPGNFYSWTFGNLKPAFLPSETPEKRPFGISGLRWNAPSKNSDNNVAVSRACLEGPDVWLDPSFFRAIFLSRSLGDALIAGGLKEPFRLNKARLI